MGRLRLSRNARRDLAQIWADIAVHNASAADRILDRISSAYGRLKTYPELGPTRPDLGDNARMLVVDQWLVLYTMKQPGVEIVRIVHGAIDLRRLDPKTVQG